LGAAYWNGMVFSFMFRTTTFMEKVPKTKPTVYLVFCTAVFV
jgi:hypothetical protein